MLRPLGPRDALRACIRSSESQPLPLQVEGGVGQRGFPRKEPPAKVKPSVIPRIKPRVLVGSRVVLLSRIFYGEQCEHRGTQAPSFGLYRPLAFVT
jgi:hypothetical protein